MTRELRGDFKHSRRLLVRGETTHHILTLLACTIVILIEHIEMCNPLSKTMKGLSAVRGVVHKPMEADKMPVATCRDLS